MSPLPHSPAPVQPPQHQFSAVPPTVPAWHSCFHQLSACLHHIYVSQLQRLEESLASTETPPFNTDNPPTKATFHPPLVERIPICPGAKFQPCFVRAERRASWCLPRDGLRLPPQVQKNATNYWGSNTESFLLTPDRYAEDPNWHFLTPWVMGEVHIA